MAATATEVLALVNKSGGIPIEENETDIYKATRGFRHRCLTRKEVEFYESIRSVKSITANAERRALAEEAKPWSLLNLPEVSVATRARLLEVQLQRAQQLAETEKKIKEILARRGEGEYDPEQQVVSFEGFTPPTETKDIDRMTKDELITLAKGHIKNTRSMKKDELLKQLKAFIAKNPGRIMLGTETSLRNEDINDDGVEGEQLIEDEEQIGEMGVDTGGQTEEDPIDLGHADGNSDVSKSCSILECDGGTQTDNLIWCGECDLWFCIDLHGPHRSHSAQTHFKSGRIPKTKAEDATATTSFEEMYSAEDAIIKTPIEKIPIASDDSLAKPFPGVANNKSQSITQTVAGSKRSRGQIETAGSCDMDRVYVAINKVRGILEHPSKNKKDQLRSALNFTSYDIIFLTMVAKEFGIDVSNLASKHRASRTEVLDSILSKLD